MRLVRTLISDEDREAVLTVLEEENIDYIVSREVSGRGDLLVVEFPLPEQALEVVLDKFQEAGHSEHAYTVAAEATSVLSTNIGEVEDRFVVGEEEDSSIASEELRPRALELLPNEFTFHLLTVLSAIVAVAGLMLDSPALVVGSMVIAPLVGSSLTASVGTVLGDSDMILKGFKTQIFGLGFAVLGSIAFGFILKNGLFLPPSLQPSTTTQIANRISPGLLSLIIGVCAGAAGAIGIATGISAALVGVMIAAALIPAAAALGVGVVWADPGIAIGAFILLVVNAASIHVSGVGMLWHLGYRPDFWTDFPSHQSIRQLAPSLLVILLLLGLFITVGGAISTHIAFERSTNVAVEQTLEANQYQAIELVEVRAEFNEGPGFSSEQDVTVVVRRPPDRGYPELSQTIRQRIITSTDRNPVVHVEFIDSQQAPPA